MQLSRKPLPVLTGKEKNIGFLYLIFQIFFLPVLLQLLGSAFSYAISETLINFIYFSVNFVFVLMIFGKFLTKSFLRCRRNPKEILVIAVLGLLAYWLIVSLMSTFTHLLFPEFVNLNDNQIVTIFGDYPALMFLCTVILAPVTEEVLHRGLIFGTLAQKRIVAAYILSALLFAAIHVVQYIGLYSPMYLVLALLNYLPAGLVLAWAYHHSGSIFCPILIHTAINAIAISLTR